MKKRFTKFLAALALLVFMMPSLAGWGQTRADGDTHDFSQSLSQLLNNNHTIESINIAEQSYPVKKVTVVGSYNKSYNPAVTIEVTVGGTSWGTQQVGGSGDFTKDFTGTATVGAIVISFTNETGSGTGHGTFNVKRVTLTEGSSGPAPTYTVTLGDDNTELTQASAGASVTLPERGDVDPYSFEGWSETDVEDETTTAPTIIPVGAYIPTSDITLYPVYTRTETGSGTTNKTASTTIASYATANNWVNSQRYTSITLDENITATGKDNGNNSKYYSTSPGTWRHYAGDSGEITITAASGTLSSVTFTYSGNTLTNGGNNVTSGNAYEVSGSSAVFAVSGTSSNTQVSAISVSYTITGGTTTYYWSWPVVSTDPVINASNPDALAYNAAGGEFGYSITNPTSATLNAVSNADWITNVAVGETTVTFNTSTNTAFTQRTGTITLSYTGANDKVTTITQNAAPAPSITASDVNIAGDATNGSIAYTISNPVSDGVLTASTDATWLTPGEVTNDAVPFTCTANQGAAREATVVLTYTYNTNQTVTKNVTVTQAKAPYTTIPALFAAATSTNKTVDVTFNNWVVSGVNDSQAFLTDNQGNGLIIYQSDHGFGVNDVLSGTASCNLVKYNGSAELTDLTSETSGLSVSHNGTLTEQNIAINALTGVNTGAVLSYENLKYNGTAFEDAQENTIQPYNTLYSYSTPETNHYYNVKGVYLQYNSKKEILPRSAADIVLKAQMTAPTFNAFTYVVGGTPTAQTAAIAGTGFSGNLTVTVAEGDYVVSNDGSNYGASATFTQSNGTISNQTLYVKLNSGLSANTYNGKLSFTADYLDAFDVNLEGSVTDNPTYNVTLTQPTGGIATIASDPAYAQSGATITLSYSDVDDCYEFTSWSVMYEDTEMHEIIPDANNQFQMPAAEVFVSAIFTQKTFTVNYSVNGYIVAVLEEVNCGDDAPLYSSSDLSDVVSLPGDCTLLGWSTVAGNTTTVPSFTPEADATLYAVLGYGEDTYELVTNVSQLSVDDVVVIAASEYNYAMSTTQNTNNRGQAAITKDGTTISLGNDVCEFVLGAGNKDNTWSFYDGGDSKGYLYAASSSANHLKTENTLSYNSSWTISISDNVATITAQGTYTRNLMQYNNNSSLFAAYASDKPQNDISLYKKVSGGAYTNVLSGEITSNMNISESPVPYHIPSGAVVDAGTNLVNSNPANLIIEDGGQLICNSSVAATVKKTIAAASKAKYVYGWNTISSPVHTGGNGYVSIGASTTVNLTANEYDMFAYDEANMLWLNQKEQLSAAIPSAGFTVMNNGQGYIYRNSAATDISFVGNTNAGDVTINLTKKSSGDLAGFNLIGNPYPHSIKKGSAQAIDNANLASGFYVLSGGKWLAYTDDEEIVAKQGILVKTSTDDNSLTIKDVPYTAPAGKYHNDNIKFMVSNSRHEDVAYAWFDKGIGLDKISHRDPEAPMLYINQDGKDYAIATMSDDTKAFDLNFRAMTTGTYTLSYKANGNYTYLHVIDRMTGEDVDMLLEGAYSFVGSPKDNENRFIVRLGYMPDYSDDNDEIFAYQSGNDIYVSGQGELQIFDVMGRMVATQRINGVETMHTSYLQNGVYVFKMNGMTQKIVVR